MSLLSITKRKNFFKVLKLGEYNKTNILKLQRKYFDDEKEHDGIYGKNTDILLRHIYNVKMYSTNFEPEEFKCGCGGRFCNGYPDRMRAKMIKLAQRIRSYFGRPMVITSGLRCKKYNRELSGRGSIEKSKHIRGSAIDYYIATKTDSLLARKKTIEIIKNFENHHFSYGDGIDSNGSYRSANFMGNAIHTEI